MNAGLAKHAADLMLPLSARDFLGKGGPASAATALTPLEAPQTRGPGGTFRQSLAATQLKPLTPADAIPGVRATAAAAGETEHDKITAQAQKWVAQTFYGTLLKQMHESPFKSQLFSGGRGAEAFQPLVDQHLIDRMSRSSGKKLVRGIVRQIEGREAYKRQQAAKAQQPAASAPAGYDAVNAAKKPSADGDAPKQDDPRNPKKNGGSRVATGLRA